MIILDENIIDSQRALLTHWKISIKQVGQDFTEAGILDENLIPLFHQLGNITFITRDKGFFTPINTHKKYCLIVLGIGQNEVATYARKVLNHPDLNTNRKRMGKVIFITYSNIRFYTLNSKLEMEIAWE